MDNDERLTPRQQAFVDRLAADPGHCYAEAARQAGYSQEAAPQIGHRLMTHEQYRHVQRAYQRRAEQAAEFAGVTPEDIYRLFAAQMFVDRNEIRMMVERDLLEHLTQEQRLVLESVKKVSRNDGSGEFESVPVFADRQRAAITMAKMMGLLNQKHEHKVEVEVEVVRESLSSKLSRLAAAQDEGSLAQQPEPPGAASP